MRAKIKKSVLAGIFFSCIASLFWLLLSSGGKKIAVSMIIVTAMVFLINLLVYRFSSKYGKRAKILCKSIAIIITAILFLAAAISVIAEMMLFNPYFDETSYEALKTKKYAEELSLSTTQGVLSGWQLKCEEVNAPVILYFGGNGENSSARIKKLSELPVAENPFANSSFVFFDYPGYGKSSGTPSEATLMKSGLAAYDWVKENYPNSDIIVMGYSIGTGVANYVAMEKAVEGLILMAPYADGYDLFNSQLGIFYGPMRLLVTFRMQAVQFAKSIDVKALILATDADEAVPFESSKRLSEAYLKGCEFITIKGITHNEFWGNQAANKHISRYIDEVQK